MTATALSAGLAVRDAVPADDAFERRLYRSTREAELSGVSWDEPAREAFFAQQFSAQALDYRRRFPRARFLIVEKDGTPIGRLCLAEDGDVLRLLDVALVPAHRGAGIGSVLMRWVIAKGRRVTLSVGKWNPAHRLYSRLDFAVVDDQGPYLAMERVPVN